MSKNKFDVQSIVDDLKNGRRYGEVKTKHHVPRAVIYLCNLGIDAATPMQTLQSAANKVYRLHHPSGLLKSRRIKQILAEQSVRETQ